MYGIIWTSPFAPIGRIISIIDRLVISTLDSIFFF